MDHPGLGSQPSDKFHKPKSSTKQLQLHVASIYAEIAQMISQKDYLQIEMPTKVTTAKEGINLIKKVLVYLLDRCGENQKNNQSKDQDRQENKLSCAQCENYEKNLQKLEGEIRNHIRTHQQLKLYQDGLEQKIQQYKKEKKEFEKKYDSLRKKYEQAKSTLTINTQKIVKFEQENEKLKNQLKQIKAHSLKTQQPKRHLNRYESNKQNFNQWRNGNYIEKQRMSIEKRQDSTQRMRVSINVKSNKGIPISSKIVQDNAKEEKAKILKNRLGF